MKINPWRTLEYDRPKFPDWDYWLTGRLSIELKQVYVYGATSPKRNFRDGKTHDLRI